MYEYTEWSSEEKRMAQFVSVDKANNKRMEEWLIPTA